MVRPRLKRKERTLSQNTTDDRLLAPAETGYKEDFVIKLSEILPDGKPMTRYLTRTQLNRLVHSLLKGKKRFGEIQASQGWVPGCEIPEVWI